MSVNLFIVLSISRGWALESTANDDKVSEAVKCRTGQLIPAQKLEHLPRLSQEGKAIQLPHMPLRRTVAEVGA